MALLPNAIKHLSHNNLIDEQEHDELRGSHSSYRLLLEEQSDQGLHCLPRLSGKFHPRYFSVEFARIFRPGKFAQSGKYGKYDFGLVIM